MPRQFVLAGHRADRGRKTPPSAICSRNTFVHFLVIRAAGAISGSGRRVPSSPSVVVMASSLPEAAGNGWPGPDFPLDSCMTAPMQACLRQQVSRQIAARPSHPRRSVRSPVFAQGRSRTQTLPIARHGRGRCRRQSKVCQLRADRMFAPAGAVGSQDQRRLDPGQQAEAQIGGRSLPYDPARRGRRRSPDRIRGSWRSERRRSHGRPVRTDRSSRDAAGAWRFRRAAQPGRRGRRLRSSAPPPPGPRRPRGRAPRPARGYRGA